MKRILISGNYDVETYLKQSPLGDGVWGNLKFEFQNKGNFDALLVLNHPKHDLKVSVKKGNKILFLQEPPLERNYYLKNLFPYFDKVVSGFDIENMKSGLKIPAALPWHVNKSYSELMSIKPQIKDDVVSWITSTSNLFPEHEVRLKFLETLKASNLPFKLFGRGIDPIDDKFDGIAPYKYSIAAENYIGDDYFTEKIVDVFLSYSMPFYSGCLNIEKYFPEGSFIRIDLKNIDQSLEIIADAIQENLWLKNFDKILEARDLCLNKYNLFPYFSEIFNFIGSDRKHQTSFIPFDGVSKWSRAKRFISSKFH